MSEEAGSFRNPSSASLAPRGCCNLKRRWSTPRVILPPVPQEQLRQEPQRLTTTTTNSRLKSPLNRPTPPHGLGAGQGLAWPSRALNYRPWSRASEHPSLGLCFGMASAAVVWLLR
jgi:hypothetical protein